MKSLNKNTLVFFHGWGFDSDIFKEFAEKLNNKYEVILINLEQYNLNYMINNILPSIPMGAVLVGWSLGGLLGVKLADLYPDRFNKIILLNTNPCFIENNNWPGIKLEVFEKFQQELEANPEKLLKRFGLLQSRGLNKYLKFPQDNKALEILKQGLECLKHENIIENLKNYDKNILMVFSNNDNLVPSITAEKIKLLNKNIKIKVLDQATHVPFLTQPDKLIGYFDEFI